MPSSPQSATSVLKVSSVTKGHQKSSDIHEGSFPIVSELLQRNLGSSNQNLESQKRAMPRAVDRQPQRERVRDGISEQFSSRSFEFRDIIDEADVGIDGELFVLSSTQCNTSVELPSVATSDESVFLSVGYTHKIYL